MAAAIALPLTACGGEASERGESLGEPAAVLRIIDGDTIDVRVDGRKERVRLLGIDTPETTTLRTGRVECGGEEAREALVRILRNGPGITLVDDPTQDQRDRYGRLLAYLDPVDGSTSVQERLLEQGWASPYIRRDSPIQRASMFRRAADRARQQHVGTWRLCGAHARGPAATR